MKFKELVFLNKPICVLGEPMVVLQTCEKIAYLHGGIDTLFANQKELSLTCRDGCTITTRFPHPFRGDKFDELWVNRLPDNETCSNYIIPSIMGDVSRIHYFTEVQ